VIVLDFFTSKFILPEHRRALIDYQHEAKRKQRNEVDEQVLSELSQKISDAMCNQFEVTITVFDPFEDVKVTGYIQKLDPIMRRLSFYHSGKKTWIPFYDILRVEFV
jgi:hypothetical protein